MDMKALIAKMDVLSQVVEAAKKKPDADGDGVPDWADKKPGKDDNEDKEKVDEAIAIQADGQEAMALLDMLKLAGQPAPQQSSCGMTEEDRDPSYVNTPDEKVSDISAATPSGNDMHRDKDSWRAAAGADNPMVTAMEGKLTKMFESMSKEDDEKDTDEWYDSKGNVKKNGAYDAGGHYHADREEAEVTMSNKKTESVDDEEFDFDDAWLNRTDPPAEPAWKSKPHLAKGPGAKWKQGLDKIGKRYEPNYDQQDSYTDRTDKRQSGEFRDTGDRLGNAIRNRDPINKKIEIKRDLKHSYPFSKNKIANKLPENKQ